MEFMLPIYRLLHFFGLALLLGGTITSWVLVKKERPSLESARLAWNCMHFVASFGLVILIFTGILQSAALYWEHFQGSFYMHLKVALAIIILGLLFWDMRTQKKILRQQPDHEILIDMLSKRQAIALSICFLTLVIMWLVSYRPF